MIYVFSGKARSGKDTAVKLLKDIIIKNNYSVLTIAYADFLKEILGKCFNLTKEQLYGVGKEKPIEGLYRDTGALLESKECWTPRQLLQYLGTDIMRKIDPECWINVVKNFVTTYSNYDFILISDGRFPNEIDWVTSRGGIHLHIERSNRDFCSNTEHISETALNDVSCKDNTFVIENNATLEELKNKLEYIWRTQLW